MKNLRKTQDKLPGKSDSSVVNTVSSADTASVKECICLEDNKMTQALCPVHGEPTPLVQKDCQCDCQCDCHWKLFEDKNEPKWIIECCEHCQPVQKDTWEESKEYHLACNDLAEGKGMGKMDTFIRQLLTEAKQENSQETGATSEDWWYASVDAISQGGFNKVSVKKLIHEILFREREALKEELKVKVEALPSILEDIEVISRRDVLALLSENK